MSAVVLPDNYGLVLFGLVGVAFQCFFQATQIQRYKFMSKEWVEKNLKEENEKFKALYGYDIPKGAAPEMVDGRHAAKLSYEDWLQYACAQRAHQNYVEGLPTVLTLGAISGLGYPVFVFWSLLVYILGRHFYCSGYRSAGPKGRMRGVWFNVPLVGMLIASLMTAYQHQSWF